MHTGGEGWRGRANILCSQASFKILFNKNAIKHKIWDPLPPVLRNFCKNVNFPHVHLCILPFWTNYNMKSIYLTCSPCLLSFLDLRASSGTLISTAPPKNPAFSNIRVSAFWLPVKQALIIWAYNQCSKYFC